MVPVEVMLVAPVTPRARVEVPMFVNVTPPPLDVMVKELSGVLPPIVPNTVTAPDVPAVSVKADVPSMVLEKEMAAPAGEPPALVVSKVIGVALRTTALSW